MDNLSNFSPDDIANWISDKGDRRTIAETYQGLRVNPGNKIIDLLINAVEMNYIDFDPTNSKFKALADRLFVANQVPYPATSEEWMNLIKGSSQSDQLKNLLLSIVSKGIKEKQQSSKGFQIEMKNGKVVLAADIEDNPDKDWIYVAIGPEGQYERNIHVPYQSPNAMKRKPQRWVIDTIPRPKGGPRKYIQKYKVHTVKKVNIVKIEKL